MPGWASKAVSLFRLKHPRIATGRAGISKLTVGTTKAPGRIVPSDGFRIDPQCFPAKRIPSDLIQKTAGKRPTTGANPFSDFRAEGPSAT
jgi:hypothetical protein